jgi:hypothetical protein
MKRMEGEKVVLEQQLADLARAGGSVWEQQREMARAKEELENLLRAGNTGARKRLREEIHKIVKRIDIWATPGSCSDLRALQDVIAKTPELLTYESSKVSAFYLKTPREWSSAGAVWNLEKRFLFG